MKLGRYEVVRELGKGAMGIVYLAKDPLIGRLVALKTIRPAAHSDDDETKEFQQRFIREAQAAGILNHPTIVTVHDIGQDETGTSFIAMEYVEGHNLKEVLAQGRPLSFDQIGDLIAQVADALDFAHSKGIVHRDVKPANIIIVEGNRAKITDFGIAKIASGSANLTTTGQFLGTPNYMAPEQIKGSPVDGRTDLFSLGICLYECLTRRKPFGGDSLTSISYKIVHEPFPPLREINPQIPEGYEEVAAKCLAKDPSKRYQRGRDLANAVRAVVRGEKPVSVEPVMADETVVTREFSAPPPPPASREHDKVPTLEIPFPEAMEVDSTPTRPRDIPLVALEGAAPVQVPEAKQDASTQPARPPRPPRPPIRQQIHKTLTNVRAYPLWRMPIAPAIFLAIVAALIVPLVIAVAVIRSRHDTPPAVDTRLEAQRARERQLRTETNELLRQRRVQDAYGRLLELKKLAPSSPYVAALLQRLEAFRHQEEIGKQQMLVAQQKLQQGIDLYNQKKYKEAIPLFEEAFHLNPALDDAVNYLKLAQQQDKPAAQPIPKLASNAADGSPKLKPASKGTRTSTGGDGGAVKNDAPARVTTYFSSPVNDGYILVKAGTQVVAHENLWEETGRFFRKRTPRVVNVTKEIIPANTDLEVWVVIPSLRIQEHKVLPQKFQPGAAHRLSVSFDLQSKRFDYQLN